MQGHAMTKTIITEALRNAASRLGHSSTCEHLYSELDLSGHSSGNTHGNFYAIINPGHGHTAVNIAVTHQCIITSIINGFADTTGPVLQMAAKAGTVHSLPPLYLG
jgi:hypothetical protein